CCRSWPDSRAVGETVLGHARPAPRRRQDFRNVVRALRDRLRNAARSAATTLADPPVAGGPIRYTNTEGGPAPGARDPTPHPERTMKRCLFLLLLLAGCGGDSTKADAKNPVVVMKTSMGTIKIELFEDKAPVTVKNFLKYVDDKHYDGTVFHRVIPGFMIQGGGFEKGLNEATIMEEVEKKEK